MDDKEIKLELEAAKARIAELERDLEHALRTVVPMISITDVQADLIKSVSRIMALEAERDGLQAANNALRRELLELRRDA